MVELPAIDEELIKKAARRVYQRLCRALRRKRVLAGLEQDGIPLVSEEEKKELRSAAGLGVAQAVQEYEADQGNAVWIWLLIAGTQRATNALRADNTRRVGKKYRQIPKGGPQKPFCAADLTGGQNRQFEKASVSDGNSPFPLDLFNHPCLTEAERAVLLGRYAENRTWAEVAGSLGIPERTCRRRHNKAIEKLRREESAKRKLKRVIRTET